MSERTIISTDLLKSQATETSTTCTWNNVIGVLPPGPDTSENPEDYKFVFNNVEYQCDYFLHGDTKFKAAYRDGGSVDIIMLEYIIETGISNIKVRTDKGFTVQDENTFMLIERLPEANKSQAFIIGCDGKVAYVDYDGTSFTLREE